MRKTIIILHGWGLCGSKYDGLSRILKKNGYEVFSPDLPGFGSEPLVSNSMKLDGYINFVRNLIEKNKIKKPVIIGHSFGGRIAVKYAWKSPEEIDKIILTGVPVIRERTIGRKVAYILAVTGGKVFGKFPVVIRNKLRKVLYFVIGEWDYYKAGTLKQVFKNIVGEDLAQYFKNINVPVLLVWGEDDKITPVSGVSKLIKINENTKCKVIPGIGHKLPYEKPEEFWEAINFFIKRTM